MNRTYTIIDMTPRQHHTAGSSTSASRRGRFKHYIALIIGVAGLILGSILLAQILLGLILFVGGFFLITEFIKYMKHRK